MVAAASGGMSGDVQRVIKNNWKSEFRSSSLSPTWTTLLEPETGNFYIQGLSVPGQSRGVCPRPHFLKPEARGQVDQKYAMGQERFTSHK